ncbi:MAG: aspartate/glutamate racemase family protein [Actinomycetia bacterium]|nr:aspartate/glutamate racemase family protein [Actinomycetes bacterium]
MLTPSSNTTLEPECAAMVQSLPHTVHFSRFPVRSISLSITDREQFAFAPMLAAAELLAHAECQVIAWNGTSAGWLGLDTDRELCRMIRTRVGVPAISTTQALFQALRAYGIRSVGLVVPYDDAVTHRIIATFKEAGFTVPVERHLGLSVNTEFARIPPTTLAALIREAAQGSEAVTVYCTNVAGAPLAEDLEREIGRPVLDSVTVTMWASLRAVGHASGLAGWGRLLREYPPFDPLGW